MSSAAKALPSAPAQAALPEAEPRVGAGVSEPDVPALVRTDSSDESDSSEESDIDSEASSALFMAKKKTPPKRERKPSGGSSRGNSRPGTPSTESGSTSSTLWAAASKLEQGEWPLDLGPCSPHWASGSEAPVPMVRASPRLGSPSRVQPSSLTRSAASPPREAGERDRGGQALAAGHRAAEPVREVDPAAPVREVDPQQRVSWRGRQGRGRRHREGGLPLTFHCVLGSPATCR